MSHVEEKLHEIHKKMEFSWSNFVRDMQVPNHLVPALMSGRPELIPKTDNQEIAILYEIIKNFMETNRTLQTHAACLAELVNQLQDNLRGINKKVMQLDDAVNYRDILDNYED